MGVAPRALRNVELMVGCSAELLRGVCIPEGVEPPLILFRLVGAGLAEPEAVFLFSVPVPFVREAEAIVGVTDRREGRGVVVVPLDEVGVLVLAAEGFRCGMREGVASSVLSKDSVEPCLDGGLDPCRLTGLELGFEPALEPTGVCPVRVPV